GAGGAGDGGGAGVVAGEVSAARSVLRGSRATRAALAKNRLTSLVGSLSSARRASAAASSRPASRSRNCSSRVFMAPPPQWPLGRRAAGDAQLPVRPHYTARATPGARKPAFVTRLASWSGRSAVPARKRVRAVALTHAKPSRSIFGKKRDARNGRWYSLCRTAVRGDLRRAP